jgi:hypothetical protein
MVRNFATSLVVETGPHWMLRVCSSVARQDGEPRGSVERIEAIGNVVRCSDHILEDGHRPVEDHLSDVVARSGSEG